MKSFTFVFALGFVAMVSAYAVPEIAGNLEQRDVQTVDLLFLAGPASFNLSIPADGTEYATSRYLSEALRLFHNHSRWHN